ncbi:MAG TPA: rRNA adenine N-6-methyltransferase family protein [Terriglobales bacterium]|nr:rRNA adenine N-6-methyltransferase family protein [Terriglobales bacterium]
MSSTTAGLGARSLHKLKSRTAGQRQSLEQAGLFLKNFFRHPKMLGSAIPSSRYLTNRVLDRTDWETARTIIEFGPGVGTFTRNILSRMSPEARLLAIELNSEFCQALTETITDPRFEIAQGSAAEVKRWMYIRSLPKADFILSGIPYSLLSHEMRQDILTASRDSLTDDGVFVAFQYTRWVLPDLQRVFSRVEEDFEPMNILPARVFYCRV